MAEEVSILKKATIRMRQPGRVLEIVSALRRGGGDRLQVISDFDMTLSRFAYNGKRCPSSYNILDNSKIISEECRKELKALLHHYYPIEIDPHRTIEEKLPHMVKWWTKAHDCLCQQKIQKFQIAEVVRESNAMLREGYKTFFNTLDQNNIPLLIFSAGIGDILEEIIRQMKVFHPNIHIVSNYMDFDKDGFLQGFKGQLIHTYNKNSSVFENSGYFQQLKGRTNIILLGDTMGDLTMADGVPGVENILKIGFLNDKVEEQRESYMDAYDIVLEKDETLDVVNGLLKHILHQRAGWRSTAPERAGVGPVPAGLDGEGASLRGRPAVSLLFLVCAEESPGHPEAAGSSPLPPPFPVCVLQGLWEPCQVGGSKSHSK
ncbi:PREDICTED: 7-methylguanosine phosphate-specific 5'-nucleotidase isoform X2 [Hipposideros armiger]|uniref:5'-nucleotidase n=1 Tax=Hipposideros armiger TaxID=186990 RepID=A0A8B7TC54_HIPAR|nr:PREDICTED: 7-methylguanosine phosphate-specific 5'-nucleotidase isoform X2 [Hipposideros armiger]